MQRQAVTVTLLVVMVFASLLITSPALAQSRTLRGSLDNTDSLFRRPYGEGCLSTSGIGSDVLYDVYHLRVSQGGRYTFSMMDGTIYDTYFYLYEGHFNPVNPRPCLALNDDFYGVWSHLEAHLTPGVDYYFVISTYLNGDSGAYQVEVSGPGDIILPDVDESSAWSPGDARINPDPAAEIAVYCGASGVDLWGLNGAYFGFVNFDDFAAAPPDDATPFFTSADGSVRVYHLANEWWAVEKDQARGDASERYRFTWDGCTPSATTTEVYAADGSLLVYEVGP
ncbi:MAG: hypothetical protein JW910_02145 [Anaerolineae bacterium]|nr:hypothetical protein [Anaerolineae bacterium]